MLWDQLRQYFRVRATRRCIVEHPVHGHFEVKPSLRDALFLWQRAGWLSRKTVQERIAVGRGSVHSRHLPDTLIH
jgi:hypothetical protein